MTITNTEEMYRRIYIDSSCTQELTYLHDINPTGKTSEQMQDESQRISDEGHMYEQDKGYKIFLDNLWQIEEFVTAVISDDQPAFTVRENSPGIFVPKGGPLAKYFKWVFKFAFGLEPDYQYSAHVQLFHDCWMKLKLGDVNFQNPSGNIPWSGKKQFELFNAFVSLIRTEEKKPEFIKKISRAKEKSSRRYRRAELYVDSLFQQRDTKLLVLRIDFSYLHKLAKDITVKQANDDLNHFLNNRRGKTKLFSGWAGYIRKTEWSPQKGVHFHLVIFYQGSKRCKDEYLARQIGEYWMEITNKRGIYWNCNDSKDKYKRCGIGMIEINDIEKRKILLDDVIDYLTKTEQLLRPSELKKEGDKLFVTGLMPRERTSTVGRPRKKRSSDIR